MPTLSDDVTIYHADERLPARPVRAQSWRLTPYAHLRGHGRWTPDGGFLALSLRPTEVLVERRGQPTQRIPLEDSNTRRRLVFSSGILLVLLLIYRALVNRLGRRILQIRS
ncbi:MAG: hypothetical protein GYB68_05160 [Chloroflexi bacterium]|nr:hypothetical protein [Chloroflexota bacterium]